LVRFIGGYLTLLYPIKPDGIDQTIRSPHFPIHLIRS